MKNNNKKLYFTALILYLNYFVHGIGVSILGQYKQDFAANWGAKLLEDGSYDVSSVLVVIAALGLGRLITLPFSGAISDKLGRKTCSIIGMSSYIIYFIGVVFSPNMYVAYICALFGGAANSFLDTGVIPACMEILVGKSGLASILTKLFISGGQLVLPTMIGYVAANNMSFGSIFYLMGIILAVLIVILIFAPMPDKSTSNEEVNSDEPKQKIRLNAESLAVIAIGFTCTSTFQLWLNCNQELGKLYGVADPSKIQSWYSTGSIIAVLVTGFLVSKFMKPVRFLILYPVASAIMLAVLYFVENPNLVVIGGAIIGFTAAGGVLQLATSTVNDMFPFAKGKITSIIMIASSLANYTIINLAGYLTKIGGVNGPKYVLILNLVVTIIGILLAIFVNLRYNKTVEANK